MEQVIPNVQWVFHVFYNDGDDDSDDDDDDGNDKYELKVRPVIAENPWLKNDKKRLNR